AAEAASERVAGKSAVVSLESIVLSSWIDLDRGAAGAHVRFIASKRAARADLRDQIRGGRNGGLVPRKSAT
ncbi:MAG: hypothetical protein E6447_15545, partial [Bradyrhizobium sp.]|nr:hypothetical protein [Bradyrhizobium sp.]